MEVSKLKVDQLRQYILDTEELEYSESVVAKMTKKDLVKIVTEYMDGFVQQKSAKQDEISVEFEDEENDNLTKLALSLPRYGSPEWQTYILSKLEDDEMYDGAPKMAGLRRVAQEVLGPIVFSGAESINVIPQDGTRAVTVNYRFDFAWTIEYDIANIDLNRPIPTRTFMGVADCIENADCMYARHPAAMAETKAMARALKSALSLNVVTTDEKMSGHSSKPSNAPSSKKSQKITTQLLNTIKNKCKMMRMDFDDSYDRYQSEILGNKKTLDELTAEEGVKFYAFLDKLSQD